LRDGRKADHKPTVADRAVDGTAGQYRVLIGRLALTAEINDRTQEGRVISLLPSFTDAKKTPSTPRVDQP
jgi:hypothetical protein